MAEKKWFRKLKGIKNIEVVVALILAAIVILIFFSNFGGGGNVSETKAPEGSFAEYVSSLETKLKKLISTIRDVGEVDVMITFASGVEQVYAYETETVKNGNTETTTTELVYVSGKPLVVKENLPEILGVAVSAQGADQIRVKMEIITAVQTLLKVEPSKVEVFTRK